MPKCLIVFDIDGVLCWQTYDNSCDPHRFAALHPECPLILFPNKDHVYPHCFAPHLDVLIEYLISNGSRIAFFSAGHYSRNNVVINELLIELLGEERYTELKSAGQFDIFSANDMREASYEFGETGNYVKDLNIILKDQETSQNSILIEDNINYAAYDQQPCIMAIPLGDWSFLLEDESEHSFSKNAVYYLLGIFSHYFNLGEDLPPLRVWVERFFLEQTGSEGHFLKKCYMPQSTDQLVLEMINLGLQEVQKKHPDAIFYNAPTGRLAYSHSYRIMPSI